MKKTFFTVAMALVICSSASALTFNDVLLWIPNRCMDALDIVSVGVGSHLGVPKVGVRVTRAFDFNFGDAAYTMFRWDYNRWLGVSLEQGHSLSFAYLGTENYRIERIFGFYLWNFPLDDDTMIRSGKYSIYKYNWWEHPLKGNYDIITGTRDWFEIGAELGVLASLRVAIHPVEIADFLLGIFFIDIKKDDIRLDD